jgi:glycerol-3-phosphate cytidylyltransferase
MKRGITFSAFDLFHAGHVAMLSEAKNECDYLIACIHADPNKENSDKNKPIQSLLERQIQVNACRYVDETIVYESEEDVRNILRTIPWDVRIIGEEYMNKHFTGKEEFNLPNKEVYYNYRQHTFSSSELRERIKCKKDK